MDHPCYSLYPFFYTIPIVPNSVPISEEPKPEAVVKEEAQSEEEKKKK